MAKRLGKEWKNLEDEPDADDRFFPEIKNNDFLSYSNEIDYELIIGNPPYFVMKKNEVDSSYFDYFDGRPNIFILFIIRALQMLKNGGILSFVVPNFYLVIVSSTHEHRLRLMEVNTPYRTYSKYECFKKDKM